MVFLAVGVIVLIIVLVFIRKKPLGKIDQVYTSEAGAFRVEGQTNRFVIRKDDRFEFLVEDGVITACKDLTRHQEFVYYGGKDDV